MAISPYHHKSTTHTNYARLLVKQKRVCQANMGLSTGLQQQNQELGTLTQDFVHPAPTLSVHPMTDVRLVLMLKLRI